MVRLANEEEFPGAKKQRENLQRIDNNNQKDYMF